MLPSTRTLSILALVLVSSWWYPMTLASSFEATQELIDLSFRAAEISDAVYYESPSGATVRVTDDNLDRALFLKESGICWLAFRGTTPSTADWWQNINPQTEQVCHTSYGGKKSYCCHARAGYYEGYFTPSYRDELEEKVRECKSSCPDCEVVLTGHSQGGAIAAVAAVVLADLKPTIITFGQPASIVVGDDDDDDGCSLLIDESKYYRYITTLTTTNSYNNHHDFDYDPVPTLNLDADHMGHVILLGEDMDHIKYFDSQPYLPINHWNIWAHLMSLYISQLLLLQMNPDGISTDGFSVGHGCNEDFECESTVCSSTVEHECVALGAAANGEYCTAHEHCASRRCAKESSWWSSLWGDDGSSCQAPLALGESCSENSDCESAYCRRRSWFRESICSQR